MKIIRPVEERRKEYKIVGREIERIDMLGIFGIIIAIAMLGFVKIRRR